MSRARWTLAALAMGVLACGKDAGVPRYFPGNKPPGDDSDGPTSSADPSTSDGADGGTASGREGDDPRLDAPIGYTEDGGAICDEFAVRAAPVIPDVLIVLDRSGSMKRTDEFGPNVDRWTPSVAAVKAVTTELETDIRFGLMMFPGEPDVAACAMTEEPYICEGCTPGSLDVKPALGASSAIAGALEGVQPAGGTPTSATLERANKALTDIAIDVDAAPSAKYVLLVTDGQPTCPNGGGSIEATPEELAIDHDLTVKAIDGLRSEGVKTYVISYDDALEPAFTSALTEFAEHGGTNDYHAVENEAELIRVFEKIAGEVVSCSYLLEKEPPDPSYVQIKLDGKQLNLDEPDGWSIKDRAVTVEGAACKALQDGNEHTLSVQVLCQIVAPI